MMGSGKPSDGKNRRGNSVRGGRKGVRVRIADSETFWGSTAILRLEIGEGPMTPKRQITDKVVSTLRLEPGKTYDVTFP